MIPKWLPKALSDPLARLGSAQTSDKIHINDIDFTPNCRNTQEKTPRTLRQEPSCLRHPSLRILRDSVTLRGYWVLIFPPKGQSDG